MTKIKIVSNPYETRIDYFVFDEIVHDWVSISKKNENSKLRQDFDEKFFFPFMIKNIIDTIIEEYYVGDVIDVVFEGTQDDYNEIQTVCNESEICSKIALSRDEAYLTNARYIFNDIKHVFSDVEPLIAEIMEDDSEAISNLSKVSDALKDIIPICVFGNYSCGKSTFINALIGYEILPSGGDPVTAKVYEIKRSDNQDVATIVFSCEDVECELIFEGSDFYIKSQNMDITLIDEISKAVASCNPEDLFSKVNCSLELINSFEKRDRTKTLISNLIRLEVPFSREGLLGCSQNNFVIFDTPGSNSASNEEHSQVLKEALAGFSNGIPVWVSTYESADSEDNAKLCELVESIEALDKRFTMIVFNKADCSELGDESLSDRQINDILQYNSVAKMYAAGVYFVSSIMGLGAKNNGILQDKHYRREYRSHQFMYNDPDDMDYTSLYKFNIMPEHLKEEIVMESGICEKLVYANSGLLCVEYEMESFATKHSAYNKCKMADSYLGSIIKKSSAIIGRREDVLKKTRDGLESLLNTETKSAINHIRRARRDRGMSFVASSEPKICDFVRRELRFERTPEEIGKLDNAYFEENVKESSLDFYQKEYKEASQELVGHLITNFKELFVPKKRNGSFIDAVNTMKRTYLEDQSLKTQNRNDLENSRDTVSQLTADKTIASVVAEYTKNLNEAYERIVDEEKASWTYSSIVLKDTLKTEIVGTEELNASQKKELESIILNYPEYSFDIKSEEVFIKRRYLKGNFLGLKMGEISRINTKSLANNYNREIRKCTMDMAKSINASYVKSFNDWADELLRMLEENITSYNPDLKAMVEEIAEQNRSIKRCENNRAKIENARIQVNQLMSWNNPKVQ